MKLFQPWLCALLLLTSGSLHAQQYTWTTIARNSSSGIEDAIGLAARFNGPVGIAADPAGNLYHNTYNATGLAPGAYEYKVIGRNSRGSGPASDVSTVVVA